MRTVRDIITIEIRNMAILSKKGDLIVIIAS
jgi:hypothetical protein